MNLNTSLKGRLRNTNLPKTNVLLPLFEAVVNSIHSIDALKSNDNFSIFNGIITIKVLRSSQLSNLEDIKSDIIGFEIIDNGVGFNTENFNSFQTLDSEYKIALGCRGVGRLLWLKAFEKVSINSVYQEDGKVFTRTFDLNVARSIHNEKNIETPDAQIQTSVKLINIQKEYLKYLRKTSAIIARDLLEHCLWYFIRSGSTPEIYVEDSDEKISLHKEYDTLMINASDSGFFEIKSKKFEITHVKLRSSLQNKHTIIYSAADRVVKEELLQGKITGLFGYLKDAGEFFSYMCFLTSDYLTEKVNPERIGFNISETTEGIFADEEISFTEIRDNAILKITEYLDQYLTENKQSGIKRVYDFVDSKAPRYRPILNRIEE